MQVGAQIVWSPFGGLAQEVMPRVEKLLDENLEVLRRYSNMIGYLSITRCECVKEAGDYGDFRTGDATITRSKYNLWVEVSLCGLSNKLPAGSKTYF